MIASMLLTLEAASDIGNSVEKLVKKEGMRECWGQWGVANSQWSVAGGKQRAAREA